MADQDQRRLAAIMFTDMVGYSKLTARDEKLALRLLDEHFGLIRPILSQHGGREVKTIGDAFLVEFDSALRAVECAVQIQRTLVQRNVAGSPNNEIHVRIGIHLGDVEHRDDDVFGNEVNIANRIESVADPDGICVSEAVAREVQGKVELPLVEVGLRELKNIRPVRIYRVEMPWLRGVHHRTTLRSLFRMKLGAILSLLFLVVLFAGLGVLVLLLPPRRRMFIPVLPPEGFTAYRGSPPAISPDGNSVVFVAESRTGGRTLMIKRTDEPEARPLVPIGASEGLPFWKPDGAWIGFFSYGKLRKISNGGGDPQDICNLPDLAMSGFGATWSPNGLIVFVPAYGKGIFKVPDSGQDHPALLMVPNPSKDEVAYAWPQFLADGKRFLFVVCTTGKETNEIRFSSTDQHGESRLLATAEGLVGFKKPWLVFARRGRMYAEKIDLNKPEAHGEEVQLASNIYYDQSLATAPASMSATGSIAYFTPGVSTVQLEWVDGSGRVLEQVGSKLLGASSPSLSPDGKYLALNREDPRTTAKEIVVLDMRSATPNVITSGLDCEEPYWLDNHHIVFAASANGSFFDIFEQNSDGSGRAKAIWWPRHGDKFVADVSPAGRFALVVTEDDGKLWKLPLMGTLKAEDITPPSYSVRDATISPDGQWLAYVATRISEDEAQPQVYARHEPDGPVTQISSDGATSVMWGRDMTKLFYRRADGILMTTVVQRSGNAIRTGLSKELFSSQIFAGDTFDVAADGERFLIPAIVAPRTSQVTVMSGWESSVSDSR